MDGADPRAMRALTHPLRLSLLELLAGSGPATAAACGRALGAPQANCSFHLRQLAKYGFVEEAEAGAGADKRERRWRVAEERPLMRFGPESDGIVKRRLERLVVERETQAILEHLDRDRRHGAGGADQPSVAEGLLAGVLAVTPEQAAELKRRWRELIEPYLVTANPAHAGPAEDGVHPPRGHVRVFMAMTPAASIAAIDQGECEDEHQD
jgi:Helix-turn-helix domain